MRPIAEFMIRKCITLPLASEIVSGYLVRSAVQNRVDASAESRISIRFTYRRACARAHPLPPSHPLELFELLSTLRRAVIGNDPLRPVSARLYCCPRNAYAFLTLIRYYIGAFHRLLNIIPCFARSRLTVVAYCFPCSPLARYPK